SAGGTDGRLTLEDSTVSGNRADGVGSPLGGGLYLLPNSVALLRNSTISGNQVIGGHGGGIYVAGGSLTVEDSTISGNSAELDGGIGVVSGLLMVASSTISGNSARGGGGIFADE